MAAEKPHRSLPTSARASTEPHEPRLGILHILVGTACVAIYLGLAQSARLIHHRFEEQPAVERAEAPMILELMWLLDSVGKGLALGGLLLWAARRLRGMPFPKYPGEYLLVVLGIFSISSLGTYFLYSLATAYSEHVPPFRVWLVLLVFVYLVGAVICLWIAVLVKIVRWRRFFYLCALVEVLSCLSACWGIWLSSPMPYLSYVLIAVALAVVIVRDHGQGFRYSWTHWLGVSIQMWFSLISLGWFVLLTFFQGLIFPNA